jgi:hypothetical protein
MLQGRYGVAGWRRQIRLEAYARFLNATHDFDSCLNSILKTIDESNFDEERQKLEECYSHLQNAATSVAVAGPKSIDGKLTSIMMDGNAIIGDVRNRDAFMSIVNNWRNHIPYDKWTNWLQSAEQFTPAVRRILKTE